MNIRKIAIIGAGTMGSGIAQVAAQGGYEVLLEDVREDLVKAGLEKVRKRLEKMVSDGRLEAAAKERTLSNIRAAASLQDCQEADLVIEAAAEKEEVKKHIFQELGRLCRKETVFATNTSAISITRLAGSTERPAQFIGMHFMNPAHKIKLLEVVRGLATSEETVNIITAVAEKMGKTPVVVNDYPGFVTSRLIMNGLNDAIFCLQEGVATRKGIDTIMRLGANHPMGPLELADFIGLDICLATLELLHAELGEKYRPCALLRKMVEGGRLGRKSGGGFYEY
jgi:3-hydroxybutyryl-CoA dehydrogenase